MECPPRPKILLVPDVSLYLAFRLPRIILEAGCDVELLCLHDELMLRSRHVCGAIREGSREAVFQRLCGILSDPARRWKRVVIADESLVRRLAAAGDGRVLEAWQPGAANAVSRRFFMDKLALARIWEDGTLWVPPGRPCSSIREVVEFGREHGWPVILKPRDGMGGYGVVKIASAGELEAKAGSLEFPLLAQKFIFGRRGVVDMVASQGRALAWLTSFSTRRFHGRFSGSTARLFRAMPTLAPLIAEVASQSRFEGFCGFDWIREGDTGRHYLIEFHPRPSSGFRFGRVCGVDFSAAVRAWLGGSADSFFPASQAPGRAVRAHYFSSDLFRCLRQRDWAGLRAWVPWGGVRHDVFMDDFPLMLAWAGRRVRECVRRIF